jgi:hypothetical protein
MLAPPDWIWSQPAPRITWFDRGPGSVGLGGRFAIVDDGSTRRIAFVRPGTFVVLPEVGDWPVVPTAGDWRPDMLLQTAARLWAIRRRLDGAQVDVTPGTLSATVFGRAPTGPFEHQIELRGRIPTRVAVDGDDGMPKR